MPYRFRRDSARLPGQALLLKKLVQSYGLSLLRRDAATPIRGKILIQLALEVRYLIPNGLVLDAPYKLNLGRESRLRRDMYRIGS